MSGYGSIFVNGTREFQVEALSQLTLDDASLDGINGGHDLRLGATVEFLLGEDADDTLSSGTATAIRAFHQVVGPITSLSPLKVMGQDVVLDDATQPDGTSLIGLSLGSVMEVSGAFDEQGNLLAGRFANNDSASIWRLRGRLRSLTADGFYLGGNDSSTGTHIVANPATPMTNCDSFPAVGDKVLVRAAAGDNLSDGLNIYDIECLQEGISLLQTLETVPADLPTSYSGVITDGPLLLALEILTNGSALIDIDGQPVRLTALTLNAVTGTPLLTDTLNLLLPGALLDVDGTLDENGVLNANRVRLLDSVTDLLGGLLGGLLTSAPATIESPLANLAASDDVVDQQYTLSLLELTVEPSEHINIVNVGPGSQTNNFLAALQPGIQAIFANHGDVEFERPLLALHD